MRKKYFIVFLLSLFPASASLRAITSHSEISNHSGFPKTMREAGECFFGNYQALVANLQDNILVNQYRIRIIKLNPNPSESKIGPTYASYNRSASVLENTNVALASQLLLLKGKCDSFPNWD